VTVFSQEFLPLNGVSLHFLLSHRPREVDKCVTWCCSARVAKHILCNAPPIRAARAPFDVFTEREARAFCVYLNSEKQCTDM
jgi:hypothetical protein